MSKFAEMIQLSVVVITYNEERNIGRCLDSVKRVADDIVVVDSFSTDKTLEISVSKGARFIQHKFEGHIEQKNFATMQSKYPYVLSLDADEALSEELQNSILEAKKNWKYDGYFMNRLTNYCGSWIHHSGWYPDSKLRLVDYRKGTWAGTNPHDKYELSEKNAKTGFLKGDLFHYSYYTIDEHMKKVEYFSTKAAEALFQKKIRPSFIKRFLSPAAAFISSYFLHLGILDGYYGFIICKSAAVSTYRKYYKLQQKYKQ